MSKDVKKILCAALAITPSHPSQFPTPSKSCKYLTKAILFLEWKHEIARNNAAKKTNAENLLYNGKTMPEREREKTKLA